MAKNIVTVKGTKEGLIFYFNTDGVDLKELYSALEIKMAEGSAFFNNSAYIIDKKAALGYEAKQHIKNILKSHGMVEPVPKATVKRPKRPEPVYESEPIKGIAPTVYTAKDGDTVFIRRSIRSGQSLHIQGNAVIMGDVNIGGHVMATGNIIVMGSLRGIAHAGIHGERNAFIIAWKMQPIQLRIANILSRSNVNDNQLSTYPEKAFIDDTAIVIKPYEESKRLKMKEIVIA